MFKEYPQTITAITKGKRGMNTALSLKNESALGIEEGYFMTLQVFYEIAEEKKKLLKDQPNLSKLRTVLFWDTKIEKIDWQKQKRAVIKRIFERGNEMEKNEIIRFYGKQTVDEILNKSHASLYTVTPLLKIVLVDLMQAEVFEPFRIVGSTALSLYYGHVCRLILIYLPMRNMARLTLKPSMSTCGIITLM